MTPLSKEDLENYKSFASISPVENQRIEITMYKKNWESILSMAETSIKYREALGRVRSAAQYHSSELARTICEIVDDTFKSEQKNG